MIEHIYEYDENDNLIYSCDMFKNESWFKYNEKGEIKEVHHKFIRGYEIWITYTDTTTHYRNSYGEEVLYKLNDDGKWYIDKVIPEDHFKTLNSLL